MKGWQVALLCLMVAALAVLGTLLYIQQTEEEAPQVDIPRYTADQVIAVAKAYAGECSHWPWQGDSNDYDASWTTAYLGDGKWRVTKECGSVTTWTFYEDTGELRPIG